MTRPTIASLQEELVKRDEQLIMKSAHIEELEGTNKILRSNLERVTNELRAALTTLKNMGRFEV